MIDIEAIEARLKAPQSFGYGLSHYQGDVRTLLDEVKRLRSLPCPYVESSAEGTHSCRLSTENNSTIAREADFTLEELKRLRSWVDILETGKRGREAETESLRAEILRLSDLNNKLHARQDWLESILPDFPIGEAGVVETGETEVGRWVEFWVRDGETVAQAIDRAMEAGG